MKKSMIKFKIFFIIFFVEDDLAINLEVISNISSGIMKNTINDIGINHNLFNNELKFICCLEASLT